MARHARRLLAAALFVASPAFAWNATGHRLVADIAWVELEAPARERVSELLRGHPDYALWAAKARGEAIDRDVFVEASLWADRIRHDARFYDAGKEPPTPTLAGYPDMERRRAWHFLNRPRSGGSDAKPLSGSIDLALAGLTQALARGSQASREERQYALPWLIHLVGDAHQPLHASTQREHADAPPGEVLLLLNPFNPRKARTTLHAFWDDLPAFSSLRGERLEAASAALRADYAAPPAATSETWLLESWLLAREHGYLPDGEREISATFYATSREVARRRVREAGHRLAATLNRLLGGR